MNYYNFNFQVPLFLDEEIKLLHKLAWFPMNRFMNQLPSYPKRYLLNLNLTQDHTINTPLSEVLNSKRSLSRFHPFDDCLLKKLGVCCSLCKWLSRNSSAKGESKITL
jgi:hypothetical protein